MEKLCKSLVFAKFLAAGTKSLVWKLDEMEKCAQGPITCCFCMLVSCAFKDFHKIYEANHSVHHLQSASKREFLVLMCGML